MEEDASGRKRMQGCKRMKEDKTRQDKPKQDETRRNKTKQKQTKQEKTKFVEMRKRTYGQVHAGPSNASHVDLSLRDGQRGSCDGDSVPVQVVPPIVREDDRSCING